jgi:predicted membrane channel-forming protein YqfA (hemolysin III family)
MNIFLIILGISWPVAGIFVGIFVSRKDKIDIYLIDIILFMVLGWISVIALSDVLNEKAILKFKKENLENTPKGQKG